uniref:Uncharacterized protein n=1 Tax=Paramoeba aestuarina TaxID=180227 RepID=A0A7S4UB43_9EUKA
MSQTNSAFQFIDRKDSDNDSFRHPFQLNASADSTVSPDELADFITFCCLDASPLCTVDLPRVFRTWTDIVVIEMGLFEHEFHKSMLGERRLVDSAERVVGGQ